MLYNTAMTSFGRRQEAIPESSEIISVEESPIQLSESDWQNFLTNPSEGLYFGEHGRFRAQLSQIKPISGRTTHVLGQTESGEYAEIYGYELGFTHRLLAAVHI